MARMDLKQTANNRYHIKGMGLNLDVVISAIHQEAYPYSIELEVRNHPELSSVTLSLDDRLSLGKGLQINYTHEHLSILYNKNYTVQGPYQP